MDELIELMRALLDEVRTLNQTLEDIRGCGANSLDQVCDGLDDLSLKIDNGFDSVKGIGLNNTLSDIHECLDDIRGHGICNSISDVCDKLDNL